MFDLRQAGLWSKRAQRQRWAPRIDDAETHVRIGLVHKGVEHFHSFPDAHAGTPAALEVDSSLDVERNSLLLCFHVNRVRFTVSNQAQYLTMLLLIEIFDAVTGILILTELCLVLFGVNIRLIVPKL